MAIPEASGLLHGPASLYGVSAVLWSFFPRLVILCALSNHFLVFIE
jgi:hypothetical protein